jgi:hypothetical protein
MSAFLEGTGQQLKRLLIFFIYVPIHFFSARELVIAYGIEGAALSWLLKGLIEVAVFSSMIYYSYTSETYEK